MDEEIDDAMDTSTISTDTNQTAINQDACRLCDKNTPKMYSIFDKNDKGQQYLHLITNCLPIIVYRTDPLSKVICEKCVTNLNVLSDFRKVSLAVADKYKDKLKDSENDNAKLFLDCQKDEEDKKELKDAFSSTDDLPIICSSCKQTNIANGELELCAPSGGFVEKEMRSQRRKPQSFYHELEDSLCSSMTEYTNTEESSQAMDQSDSESIDSDDNPRPSKRRKIDECDNEELIRLTESLDEKKKQETIADTFRLEFQHRYNPLSLLQLVLNAINIKNVPDYTPIHYTEQLVQSVCKSCDQTFQNEKLLSLHELQHLRVSLGEKIDNPNPWPPSMPDAHIRNKWLVYFDEHGFDENDIVIDQSPEQSLLIPIAEMDDVHSMDDRYNSTFDSNEFDNSDLLAKIEHVALIDKKPMIFGRPLTEFPKDERKLFYHTLRMGKVNKKFCQLCRFVFKDNWAIESHYFSQACHYTCRYCGMRFNKYRNYYDDHVQQHVQRGDEYTKKIFSASKMKHTNPKLIQGGEVYTGPVYFPPEFPTSQISLAQSNSPVPPPPTARNTKSQHQVKVKIENHRPVERPIRSTRIRVKEEINRNDSPISGGQLKIFPSSQAKNSNTQAYFCRKCYKVFFKLDEFSAHSKKCDYNQSPTSASSKSGSSTKQVNGGEANGTPSKRPVRSCAKEVGSYRDELYIPEFREPNNSSQLVMCYICNTPFPTVYARNSHMRIHKNDKRPHYQISPQNKLRINQQPVKQNNKQQSGYNFGNIRVKQEPLEPMVEIHESEPTAPPPTRNNFVNQRSLGGGAVSITPIPKNPNQKATINANIMKLVQNNPNLSIKKSTPSLQNNSPPKYAPNRNLPSPEDPSKLFKCSSCWETFQNKSHLYYHKKNQCSGSRFPCPFCKKRFGTEAAYSSHIFYSHPE